MQGDIFAAGSQSILHRKGQTTAARHGHSGYGNASDIIVFENLGQLLSVIHCVQLGAADEGDAVFHEGVMEIAVGECSTVGCNQQISSVKIRGIHRNQLQLNGKIIQLAGYIADGRSRCFFLLCCQNRGFIVGRSLPLFKGNCVHRAGGQAVTQTVAVVLPQELCLAIHNADGTFMAGAGTEAAAVASVFINGNDSSDHGMFSFTQWFVPLTLWQYDTILNATSMLNFQQKVMNMKKYNEILQRSPLFDGIRTEDLSAMLCCIGGHTVTAAKGQIIFREGDAATNVGMVLSGAVRMVREDYYGNRSIVAHIGPSELFGESYACAGIQSLPVSIVADEDSTLLLMDCRRITTTCSSACEFHNRIIFNLLKLVATKNLVFDQKIQITSRRTTREKLMAYLLGQAKLHGSNSFLIPYDRQELADYLEVDRSGLSAEISKLRREGILESEKNRFTLLG